ncbi:peptidoglycan editing factor PgeF [Lacibacterium aquatile]|uniref:Purine nucleoside phosphorylase n=1 Tax=Lacibacterium aquatile TaxID=1168082 RepID=A0ABW5DVR0_9PROT
MSLSPLTSPQLAGLPHGFFTRKGGISKGIYDSLNCGLGSDDNPIAVGENRSRVAKYLGADQLLTVHQIHSPDVVTVTEPWTRENTPKADGLVTKVPGIALGVLAADCAPLLFADKDAGVIGAAHAGWRGAFGGVAARTVEAMVALGAKRGSIRCAIGPCIGPASYEVSLDFMNTFVEADEGNVEFFIPAERDGHAMFDLPGYLLKQIGKLRIGGVEWVEADTLPDDARFFSYRRVTLAGGGDYGRQISAICLPTA